MHPLGPLEHTGMKVTVLEGVDAAVEQFVRTMSEAKLCHTWAWGAMVERVFGHRCLFLVAREHRMIRGVLPLVEVRSWLFGNRVISQAFSNYGGPIADDPRAVEALYDRAVELAIESGCEAIEFRNTAPLACDLPSRSEKVCMHLRLAADPDKVWHGLSKGIRKLVRRAEKAQVVVEGGGEELLDEFYRTWTMRMHQLGTPSYSRELFSAILETFPGKARIFVARLGRQTVAAKFTYRFNGLVQSRWGATLLDCQKTYANHLLFWEVIKHSCLTGASCFDFGRSTIGSGPYHFKMHWKPQTVNLCYQYWVRPGQELSTVSPDNARYRWKVALWKRLPLGATRLIGPFISRSLP